MDRIQSYEDYCLAVGAGGEARDRAVLMSYMRSRLIDIEGQVRRSGDCAGLDSFEPQGQAVCQYDALSRILLGSQEAVARLTDNLCAKIVRENKMTPVYRAREIDSSGISWICRRPGRNLREKLSGTRAVLAVNRRMSLDTGENRLLLAFVNAAEKLIRLKLEYAGGVIGTRAETEFQGRLARFRAIEGLEEVRRWENTPPNNTLLSDRYYRQIWNAWNELNSLDDLIAADHDFMDSRIAVILYSDILAGLKKRIRFPQLPVLADYETFSVYAAGVAEEGLEGLDARGGSLVYKRTRTGLTIEYQNMFMAAQVENGVCGFTLVQNGKVLDAKKIVLTPDSFAEIPGEVLRRLGIGPTAPLRKQRMFQRCEFAALCLTEPFPLVMREGAAPEQLHRLLAVQSWPGQSESFTLSLAGARAVRLDEGRAISTIRTILKSTDKSSALLLAGMLHSQLDAQRLTFLFPDVYNEFELSAVRGALRVHYRQLDAFPESIAAVFSLLKGGQWDRRFLEGGFAAAAKLEGRRLSITLLQSVPEPELAGQGGVIWERHPTVSYDCGEKLERLCDELDRRGLEGRAKELLEVFGLSALPKALETLALYDSGWSIRWFDQGDDVLRLIRQFSLNINAEIDRFKRSFANILKGKTPLVMLLTPALAYTANRFVVYRREGDMLSGCHSCRALAAGTEQALWRDHLPRLAIKRFIGSFDLVENAAVLPVYDRVQRLDIENTFTLAAGRQSYRFQLIQGGFGGELPFAAVVTHKAFPLRTDTECRLRLTYTYGSDDPYDLVFEPLHCAQAGFREVRVQWMRMEEHPWRGLPVPPFPERPTWDGLAAYPSRYGPENLPELAAARIEKLLKKQRQPRVHIAAPVRREGWQKQVRAAQKTGPQFLYQLLRHVPVEGKLADVYLNTRWFDNRSDAENDFEGFTCLLEENAQNTKYVTMSLSDCGAEWVSGGKGRRCLLCRLENGEKQIITILEDNFVDGSAPEQPDTLSFLLAPVSDKFRVTAAADYSGILRSRGGEYFVMSVDLPSVGEVQALFFRDGFLFDGDFPPKKGDALSFSWRRGKNGKIFINDIAVGRCGTYMGKNIRAGLPPKQYTAKYVRTDGGPSYGPFLDKGLLFPLHQIFSDGRMLTELSCPDELRDAVLKLTRYMLEHYGACAGERPGHVMFTILSLLAANIGADYYTLAFDCVERWAARRERVKDEIGFALGDLSTEYQRELLDKIETLPDDAVLCIYAHAAWKNSGFIFGVEPAGLLEHFAAAVRLLTDMFMKNRPGAKTHAKRYLELILATFRLRALGDEGISRKLSLNSNMVRELYKCLEKMVEDIRGGRLERELFFSRLKLEVTRSGEYADIPPLLFAVIGCITGETGENDIQISGIDSGDDGGED